MKNRLLLFCAVALLGSPNLVFAMPKAFVPTAAAIATVTAPDSDKDGLSDAWENIIGTDSAKSDSDGDGYLDGTEVMNGFDPLNAKPVRVEKRIEVSDKDLRLKYYFGDKLLGDIPVSTGKKSTPTPIGSFAVLKKFPEKHYAGATWNYPHTKWNLQFTSRNGLNYYIHGAYWHDQFGVGKVSGGCVNVRYVDMEPLYQFAQVGAKVVVN
jgi:hypothetical protein